MRPSASGWGTAGAEEPLPKAPTSRTKPVACGFEAGCDSSTSLHCFSSGGIARSRRVSRSLIGPWRSDSGSLLLRWSSKLCSSWTAWVACGSLHLSGCTKRIICLQQLCAEPGKILKPHFWPTRCSGLSTSFTASARASLEKLMTTLRPATALDASKMLRTSKTCQADGFKEATDRAGPGLRRSPEDAAASREDLGGARARGSRAGFGNAGHSRLTGGMGAHTQSAPHRCTCRADGGQPTAGPTGFGPTSPATSPEQEGGYRACGDIGYAGPSRMQNAQSSSRSQHKSQGPCFNSTKM